MFCSSDGTQNIVEACRLTDNFLGAVLSPFETLTGGFFGPIFWGGIVLALYVKYKNAMIALLGGLLPLFALFTVIPTPEIGKIAILIVTACGLAVYHLLHARVETPQI